jgi:fibronectin-binding autotransporter adhesin
LAVAPGIAGFSCSRFKEKIGSALVSIPQKILLLFFTVAAPLVCWTDGVNASSATWSANPESNQWIDSDNWSAGGPPDGDSDIATFASSSITTITVLHTDNLGHVFPIKVSGIIFESGASAYTLISDGISGAFVIGGIGIVNNSGIVQHLNGAKFTNNATAGTNLTALGGFTTFRDFSRADHAIITNNAATFPFAEGERAAFADFSSADHAMITNNAAVTNAGAGSTVFLGHSTAGHATIMNNGGTIYASGDTSFKDNSTADHATIVANGAMANDLSGATIEFRSSASAGGATLIANAGSNGGLGGTIGFFNNTTGGTSRIEVWGNGTLSLVTHDFATALTIGSLEGTGIVYLGRNTLEVGSNNANTSFSGSIQDSNVPISPPLAGSLVKIGTGTLTLSGLNTYNGSTTVEAGQLIVNGSITSNVTVNGGTLGGSGTTKGITVNNGGTLAPGNSPGILNVSGNLRLALGSTYLVDLNGSALGKEYDQTNVTGVVTLDGATLSLNLSFTPIAGSMFVIINNDLSDMVIGTFDGLSEGATFESGGRAFSISYHGGDGNDVVLNAVPEPQIWVLLLVGGLAFLIVRKQNSHVTCSNLSAL